MKGTEPCVSEVVRLPARVVSPVTNNVPPILALPVVVAVVAVNPVAVVVASVVAPVTPRVPESVAFAPERVPVKVGLVENTAEPVPVSSVRAVSRLAEVKEPSEVVLPTEVMAPVRFALVVTLPAVSDGAVPVSPVPAPEKLDAVRVPEKSPLPTTESFSVGVVVAIPTLPPDRFKTVLP